MKPGNALAEDLRRIGSASIIGGVAATAIKHELAAWAGAVAVVIGVLLNGVGYWLHHKEDP